MRLALFDFDGTLSTRDSLMPFLRHTCGTPRFLGGLALLAPVLGAYAVGWMANDRAKARVLGHFLGGQTLVQVQQAGAVFARTALPDLLRTSSMARLREHQARGDCCVLVSASLDVYLGPWTAAQGFDALLCSSLVTTADGHVTGALAGANCFGPEKARRITDWLAGRHPDHITAYGDSRGDDEMLAMADTPVRL
ncbi:MAG: hypothetical protein RLZ81_1004 [Pseudomonadota bacterium]|jgi:HAD superfamily hydrolase (TIGR01490 family)|uniref:HAD-IB family hydrolase n=1 Tax=Sphaerotilus montanus TaxID=522889 RepID=UPI00322F0828